MRTSELAPKVYEMPVLDVSNFLVRSTGLACVSNPQLWPHGMGILAIPIQST